MWHSDNPYMERSLGQGLSLCHLITMDWGSEVLSEQLEEAVEVQGLFTFEEQWII